MRRSGHSDRSVSRGPRRNIALLIPLGKMTDSLPQNLGCGPTDLLSSSLRGMDDLVRLPSVGWSMTRSIQELRPETRFQRGKQ